jgi:hypothetical protein
MTVKIAQRHNFILLQWLVVEGFQRCNLKLLFRQTRLCAPDSPPLQAIQLPATLDNFKITFPLI